MKRTHKLRGLGNVQATIDSSRTLDEAAGRLGVNRSTLTRWLQKGKVKHPASFAQVELREGKTPPPPPTATDWHAWAPAVRDAYTLSPTDLQIVALADKALELAYADDKAVVQLMAMARFAALVKQLNLQQHPAAKPVVPSSDVADPQWLGTDEDEDPRLLIMGGSVQ